LPRNSEWFLPDDPGHSL